MAGFSRHFRLIAGLEGATLVSLMCIAVPLKRLAGMPELVAWLGPVHGFGFLLYVWAVLDEWTASTRDARWAGLALAASLVPFGTYLLLWLSDRGSRRDGSPVH